MSGPTVKRALRNRFEFIRQNEMERLQKKLRKLNEHDRRSVDAITIDIIQALSRGADCALSHDMPEPALDALVRLFALDAEVPEGG